MHSSQIYSWSCNLIGWEHFSLQFVKQNLPRYGFALRKRSFKVFDFTLLAAKGDAKFYENSRKLYFGPIIGPFCPIFLGNQLPSLFRVSRFLSLCKILEPNKQIRRKTGYVGTYGQARNHRNSPAGGTKRHKKKLRSPMSYRTWRLQKLLKTDISCYLSYKQIGYLQSSYFFVLLQYLSIDFSHIIGQSKTPCFVYSSPRLR